MASRRSHAPTNDQQIEYELRVPQSGTYIMKPTASCEAAQLWVREILPPHIVPRRGTDTSRMMLRRKVGPASRNQVTYYMALIDDLLWEAAGLRRDAIAS